MMERLIRWGVGRYLRGPGRTWLFPSLAVLGYRAVRSMVGRKEIVDIGDIEKGQRIEIEHLDVTHREQLKAEKAAKREARKARRATRRARRSGMLEG